MHRSNQGEFVENLITADIAGMEDEVDAAKGVVNLGTQQAVRVGNETDSVNGGGRRWDVRGLRSMRIATGPTWHLVRYINVIENAADDKVHQFFDAARTMIETG